MGRLRQFFCFHDWDETASLSGVADWTRLVDGQRGEYLGTARIRACTKCGKEEGVFVWAGGRRIVPVDLLRLRIVEIQNRDAMRRATAHYIGMGLQEESRR